MADLGAQRRVGGVGSTQGLRGGGTASLTSLLTQIVLHWVPSAHTFPQMAPLGMGREDISPSGSPGPCGAVTK